MSFETKDSGKREQFTSGMVRDTNEGKPCYDLVYDGPMLERWANLLQRGAQKYEKRNWMKASGNAELERFRESAARHFAQWMRGDTDEDHAAAVYFNLNGAEYVRWKLTEMAGVVNPFREFDAKYPPTEGPNNPYLPAGYLDKLKEELQITDIKRWNEQLKDPNGVALMPTYADTWKEPRPMTPIERQEPVSGLPEFEDFVDDGEPVVDGCYCKHCEVRRAVREGRYRRTIDNT